MNMPEYDEFVSLIMDDERHEFVNSHDEDQLWDGVRTMARHIHELQRRISELNGCACAYDHPDDVCMIHTPPDRIRALIERGRLLS